MPFLNVLFLTFAIIAWARPGSSKTWIEPGLVCVMWTRLMINRGNMLNEARSWLPFLENYGGPI